MARLTWYSKSVPHFRDPLRKNSKYLPSPQRNTPMKSAFVQLTLFSAICLSVFSACDQIPGNEPSTPSLTTTAGEVAHIAQRVDLECGGADFRMFRLTLKNGSEAISMFKGENEVRTELLPSGADVKKFKLDPLRKTDDGFEMSMEHGDRYYHSRLFEFECKDGSFHLVKMKADRFDTNNPSRVRKRDQAVKPSIPFERFGLRLYLID